MNQDLFKAILAMDSYNRGYDSGIVFGSNLGSNNYSLDTLGAQLGSATVLRANGDPAAQAIGFYGIAYQLASGETVISYRGTDDPINDKWDLLGSKDVWNGWTVGGGSTDAQQAVMAIRFYNTVVDEVYGVSADPHSSGLISLTGHSLGGGLAGLVGSIYSQNVYGSDAMPFLYALDSTVYALNNEGWFSNADLRNLIYGDSALWAIPTDYNTLSNLVSGNYLAGEVLDFLRAEVSPTQPEFQTENSLYQEVFLQNYGEVLGGLDVVQLHSIPSLVIRMFADTEINGVTDWMGAAPYFWKVLYDGEFARDIGTSGVQGHLLDQAIAGDISKYADILREVIAYSAVDDGATPESMPFGDTGIRAFYNDANDLGLALRTPAILNVSEKLQGYADEISQIFIQFAGNLALNSVLKDDQNEFVLNGVLDSSHTGTLTIDLSESTWSAANKGDMPEIVGATKLLEGVLGDIGDINNLYEQATLDSAMVKYWGSSAENIFEKITFSEYDENTYLPYMEAATSQSHAALYIGGYGDNTIVGSAGNDLLWGGLGNDTVDYRYIASSDSRIVWSADGTLVVKFADGTVDILEDIEAIVASDSYHNTLELSGAGALKQISANEYDFNGHSLKLENISKIQGDGSDQTFLLQSVPTDGVDGGAGNDALNLSIAGGIYNQLNGQYYLDEKGGVLKTENVEHLNIEGKASTFVIDPTISGLNLIDGHNDFSASNKGGDFSVSANSWFYTWSFFGWGGGYSMEKSFHSSVTIDGITQNGAGRSEHHSGFGSPPDMQLSWLYLFGKSDIRGTDHGDKVNLSSDPSLNTVYSFVTGYGDDYTTVGGRPFSWPYAGVGGSTTLTYTKGNDVIYAANNLTSLNMWSDIRPSDVSISGNVITIAGHGTITMLGGSIDRESIRFLGGERSASIEGSWSGETWVGHDGRDETYMSLGGNDTLNGNGGQDKLYGGDGNDALYSLKGTGLLEGGADDDTYYVSKSALTTIYDSQGNNVLNIQDFNRADVHFVMNGQDLIMEDSSGTALLTIMSGSKFGHIEFQNGDTALLADLYAAAAGHNIKYATSDLSDIVNGVSPYGGSDHIMIDLKGGDDTYFAGAGVVADTIYGGAGDDYVVTFGGNDTVFAGTGDDTILGGSGNDYLDGGEGSDWLGPDWTGNGHGMNVDLSRGVVLDDGNGGVDTIVSIENINGSRFDDILTGDDGDNFFRGNGGNDILSGMGGDDFFLYLNSSSSVSNTVTIDGGDGHDTVNFFNIGSAHVVANLQTGVVLDNGYGSSAAIMSVEGIIGSHFGGDDITGSDGQDVIELEGGGIARGGAGNDTLKGSNMLSPVLGVVTLMGEAGDDTLIGGNKNDTLIGGAGNDVLEGGEGDDTYVFSAGDGIDIIRDNQGINTLEIGGGISLSNLVVSRVGDNLVIHIASGVTIENYFAATQEASPFFVKFADNTVLNMRDLPITNSAPDAKDDAFLVSGNQMISGNVFADNGLGVDSDADGNVIKAASLDIVTSGGGHFVLHSDGSFTYTAANGFNGIDTVQYHIDDGVEATDSATVYFAVNQPDENVAPLVQSDNFELLEDASFSGNVLLNDTDPDGDNLKVQEGAISTASGGIIHMLETGDFTYTPFSNYNGVDSFVYNVSDGHGHEVTSTVTLNVTAVNDGPVAVADAFSMDEDGVLAGNLLVDNGGGADSDVDGDALGVKAASFVTAAGGHVVVNTDGTFSYNPSLNYNGQDSFQYTVSDSHGGESVATATISIRAINDNPDAIDDALVVKSGQTLVANILLNDKDVDGDSIVVSSPSDFVTANGGHVSIAVNGAVSYSAAVGYFGRDSFQYTVSDGHGGFDTATVSLSVEQAKGDIVGNNNCNWLFGTIKGESIYGMGGDDLLMGLNGDDRLFGGAGNDILDGGNGYDLLVGGKGADWLIGGGGSDTFMFLNINDGKDYIQDFSARQGDKIDISALLEQYDPVTDAISSFVRLTSKCGETVLSVNVDGKGTDFVAVAVLDDPVHQTVQQMVKSGSLIV